MGGELNIGDRVVIKDFGGVYPSFRDAFVYFKIKKGGILHTYMQKNLLTNGWFIKDIAFHSFGSNTKIAHIYNFSIKKSIVICIDEKYIVKDSEWKPKSPNKWTLENQNKVIEVIPRAQWQTLF